VVRPRVGEMVRPDRGEETESYEHHEQGAEGEGRLVPPESPQREPPRTEAHRTLLPRLLLEGGWPLEGVVRRGLGGHSARRQPSTASVGVAPRRPPHTFRLPTWRS